MKLRTATRDVYALDGRFDDFRHRFFVVAAVAACFALENLSPILRLLFSSFVVPYTFVTFPHDVRLSLHPILSGCICVYGTLTKVVFTIHRSFAPTMPPKFKSMTLDELKQAKDWPWKTQVSSASSTPQKENVQTASIAVRSISLSIPSTCLFLTCS